MLQSLKIQNFALIDFLEINFCSELSTITGETGAGKSIIMGALSLLIGQRADSSVLKNQNEKAIVEAIFNLSKLELQWFFDEYDIDNDKDTIVRREISSNGKSRAFINDSPVTLETLKVFGDEVIDIHSQHQNHLLNSNDFQQNLLDYFAGIQGETSKYNQGFTELKKLEKELQNITQLSENAHKELQFKAFLYDELENAKIEPQELVLLEEEFEQLSHIEELKESFLQSSELLAGQESNILTNLKTVISSLQKTRLYFKPSDSIIEPLETIFIELKEHSREINRVCDLLESNPERLSVISSRIDLLTGLMQKHKVATIDELLDIQKQLDLFLQQSKSFEDEIDKIKSLIIKKTEQLLLLAKYLHDKRTKAALPLAKTLASMLSNLGMPHVEFEIVVNQFDELRRNGINETVFMFTANKNMPLQKITDTASGGEISRIMLCLKMELSKAKSLPTIVFDEIDTGVSGDVADKMGSIMKQMATNMQVICITHLPQIAAKGKEHFVVYKDQSADTTTSNIKKLNSTERIQEIAKMISGKVLTNTAIQHAEELLKGQI